MTHFITQSKKILPVLFWLGIWQIASMLMKNDIFLVSPWKVATTLFFQLAELSFWKAIGFSFWHILLGFFMALVMGILFALLSAKIPLIRSLIAPLIAVMKATPVASFIILALIWIDSQNLSTFISFLMVFPILYANTLQGILHVDRKMLEMAQVFQMKPFSKFIYIYLPDVFPFFVTACSLSLGLCWKSGIAAEVIGLPSGSIGEKLYQAKIYLNTPELFAYTITILVISLTFEKAFLFLLNSIKEKKLHD